MKLESNVFQPVPPLFQPLRYWTQRSIPERGGTLHPESAHGSGTKKPGARHFSMQGGFIAVAGGERRMVIAGKLFRSVG